MVEEVLLLSVLAEVVAGEIMVAVAKLNSGTPNACDQHTPRGNDPPVSSVLPLVAVVEVVVVLAEETWCTRTDPSQLVETSNDSLTYSRAVMPSVGQSGSNRVSGGVCSTPTDKSPDMVGGCWLLTRRRMC